jgi:hypothetical protein
MITIPQHCKGVLIETDLLAGYLVGENIELINYLFSSVVCYTTFIQVAELISAAKNKEEKTLVKNVLMAIRPLGFHPRYSEELATNLAKFTIIDDLTKSRNETDYSFDIAPYRFAITSAIAKEAKIHIVSSRFQRVYSQSGCDLLDISTA